LNFELLLSRYICHNFSLNENRSGRDFSFDSGLLTNGYMTLGNDLALDVAINRGLPVEM